MTMPHIIDLTHIIDPDISVYPGSDHPVLKNTAFLEKHGFREKELTLSTHHGTHIDCPFHLLGEGFHTGNAAPDRFFGSGMVMDCRSIAPGDDIPVDILQPRKSEIAAVDFLLLLTGMDRYWKTPGYAGSYPVLTTGAAVSFLSKDMIIIENLTGLEKILDKKFLFLCFPLRIEEGDGSPVRACAVMEEL
jgi:arylformamidase